MIDKLFNSVIEQVYNKTGELENNIVMACYNNDFSMNSEELERRYSGNEDDVYFACFEFEYGEINGAYMPFIDIIHSMFDKYIGGSINDFLDSCGVYELHKEIYRSYFEEGFCRRAEHALLGEVEYEKQRMTEDVVSMLCKVTQEHPVVIVINRFQLAGESSVQLIINLIGKLSKNIGIVLGANENRTKVNIAGENWDTMIEMMVDEAHLYHLGYTGLKRKVQDETVAPKRESIKNIYRKINNCNKFMDINSAMGYFRSFERQMSENPVEVNHEWEIKMLCLYCETAILAGDMSKAIDVVDILSRKKDADDEHEMNFTCAYYTATCYMYLGKLDDARMTAQQAYQEAVYLKDEKKKFVTEVLIVQIKMSGWYNIFFCVTDVEIEDTLIEKLHKYGYRNHLAYIYIYAYDNKPEMVAKANKSEALLVQFSKGIEIAKAIGNTYLIGAAFRKNTMIASTNGMNNIAMLYIVRACEYVEDTDKVERGMAYISIGYNLSALGYNELADDYYNRGIEMFSENDAVREIAETNYNKALNYIMIERYMDAERCLEMAMKTVERLHMNSLRVCNISKLYALLALATILQKKLFDCERNLINCKQFLNFVLMRAKNADPNVIIHDYALCDDDLFLYNFAMALLHMENDDDESAYEEFVEAEKHLIKAEGNQFFAHRLYIQNRMILFKRMGKVELYEKEAAFLKKHDDAAKALKDSASIEMLDRIRPDNLHEPCNVTKTDQDRMSKNKAVEIDYQNSRRQMDFLGVWQNIIDTSNSDVSVLVHDALRYFLNYFSNDKAIYIRYEDHDAEILFDNTYVEWNDDKLEQIRRCLKHNPEGVAVSKVSDNFLEHMDLVAPFGVDEVCSFVAIPFMSNGKIKAVFITYILMKDNWHNSINRYMLDYDDLRVYKLLFRELYNAIKRLEANKQIRSMNRQLSQNAITDMLTGLYNRAGLYKGVQNMKDNVTILFLDLDNFKPYNDTFGHDAGDIILVGMAKIFEEVAGGIGFVCRYGGDEFIIVAHTVDRAVIEKMVHEIYKKIEAADGFQEELRQKLKREVVVEDNKKLTVSIGIAIRRSEDESIDDTIKRADDLMYTVKINGKGTYAFI